MTKRQRPVDVLPTSLPPRGLSRVLAAGYIGVSVGLFDQMVADGRMPWPKTINTRNVWDRLDIDRHFEALDQNDANPWDEIEETQPSRREDILTSREALLDIPRTPEEWKERERLWRIEVVSSPLQSRELMGLAGLYQFKSEKIKQIKGASIGTMERLEARGFVEPDGVPKPGRCPQYKITEAGEKTWEALPEAIRAGVTFTTAVPFKP